MEIYIHYHELPQDKELADIVGELNDVLEEGGRVCGGTSRERKASGVRRAV